MASLRVLLVTFVIGRDSYCLRDRRERRAEVRVVVMMLHRMLLQDYDYDYGY